MIKQSQIDEAIARFGMPKQANVWAIVPSVSGTALGGYFGKKYLGPQIGQELGPVIGAIGGGIGGKMLSEKVEAEEAARNAMQSYAPPAPQYTVPAGAPYAIDSTLGDIPPWALAGTRLLMKQGSALMDHVVLPDTFGTPITALQEYRKGSTGKQIAARAGGQAAGTLAGGLLGHGAGHLIDHFVGHKVKLPGNIDLSLLLAGAAAAAGSQKGFDFGLKFK